MKRCTGKNQVKSEKEKGMEAIERIKTRRSIRKFKSNHLDKTIVENIVKAASFAPSWKNTQIARYTYIDNEAVIKKIADEAVLGFEHNSRILSGAPGLFAISVVTGRSGYEKDGSFSTSKKDGWQMFDAGIAAQTLCLAAAEYGIGTVIMGIFDDEKAAKIIELPEGQQVAVLIACGYPDETPVAPNRKDVSDILRFITK